MIRYNLQNGESGKMVQIGFCVLLVRLFPVVVVSKDVDDEPWVVVGKVDVDEVCPPSVDDSWVDVVACVVEVGIQVEVDPDVVEVGAWEEVGARVDHVDQVDRWVVDDDDVGAWLDEVGCHVDVAGWVEEEDEVGALVDQVDHLRVVEEPWVEVGAREDHVVEDAVDPWLDVVPDEVDAEMYIHGYRIVE